MKRKCFSLNTQRTNNKKKTKERTRWKTKTVQEEKFLHTFEFKWENKFYANKCKVEKVIVNGAKQQWQRFPSYRYAIRRCRVLSKFNKIPVSWQWTKRFHFSFYFFHAIEGMKILITTKSHLVPLLSQQKRMKWSGTDFGWWMHSTYPKIKVDESLVEPKKCLCFVYSSSTTNEWIRFVLLLMHFQFYRSLWWNSWKLRRKSNERKFVYNAMRNQVEICSAKIQFQLRQHMLLYVFVFFFMVEPLLHYHHISWNTHSWLWSIYFSARRSLHFKFTTNTIYNLHVHLEAKNLSTIAAVHIGNNRINLGKID